MYNRNIYHIDEIIPAARFRTACVEPESPATSLGCSTFWSGVKSGPSTWIERRRILSQICPNQTVHETMNCLTAWEDSFIAGKGWWCVMGDEWCCFINVFVGVFLGSVSRSISLAKWCSLFQRTFSWPGSTHWFWGFWCWFCNSFQISQEFHMKNL